ncbi:Hypothetical protein PBC10988_23200 [Planctomycetales bacterium 10988]|nr:Hypothetical protein PBC10988_23200 [Planctomycetales bacterium 10988]
MAIVDADMMLLLSTKSGSAGYTLAQADPDLSLGKYASTTEMSKITALHNLFDKINGKENKAEDTEFRLLFLYNSHATLPYLEGELWVELVEESVSLIEVGLDPAGASPVDQSEAQAAEIADEGTAPVGVSFAEVTEESPLVLGDIPAGHVLPIWFKRLATNSGPKNVDGQTILFSGDTQAEE